MRQFLGTAALIVLLAVPNSSQACSMVACSDKGAEMRRDFVVKVTYRDKPLFGVSVWVASGSLEQQINLFSGLTSRDGSVRIANLAPGEYWLHAELLNVVAGVECFYVGSRPSKRARKAIAYEWGELAPTIREVAGKFIDSQPGNGGNPLWNLTHRVDVPVREARLNLVSPFTRESYATETDADGHFSFRGISPGTYVLNVIAGTEPEGRHFGGASLVIQLSDTADRDTLVLEYRDAGGGSCGGTGLRL